MPSGSRSTTASCGDAAHVPVGSRRVAGVAACGVVGVGVTDDIATLREALALLQRLLPGDRPVIEDAVAALDRVAARLAELEIDLQEANATAHAWRKTAEIAEAQVGQAKREREEAREMYGRAADRMTIEIIEREDAEARVRELTDALNHLSVWVETGCDHYRNDQEAVEAARAVLAAAKEPA